MRTKFMMLTLFLFSGVVAVGCDAAEDADSPDPQAEAVADELTDEENSADDEEQAVEATGDEEEVAGDDGEFTYPDFELGELSASERGQLADLATSELCPCPDSVISLHDCMQEAERCEEADELATSLVDAVADGADGDDAFDQVARDRADVQEVHRFSLDEAPKKGNSDADITIVEFADFQCPHCRTAAQAMDEVAERFGDDVGIYFKFFPLGSPTSDQTARAAIAAHQQGRFWQMHKLLFDNQRQIDRSMIDQFARQLGLNFNRFRDDMDDEELRTLLARDRHEGMEAGVQGTPAIFINGELYTGAISSQAIGAKVRSLLDES